MLVLKTPRFGLLGIFSTVVILQVRPMSMALPLLRSMFLMEIGLRWLVPLAIPITVSGWRFQPPPAACGRRVAGPTYRAQMILAAAIPNGFRFGLRILQMHRRRSPALRLTNHLRFMVWVIPMQISNIPMLTRAVLLLASLYTMTSCRGISG